jgi:hypothetical protein
MKNYIINNLEYIKKILISAIVLLVLSFLVMWLVYDFSWRFDHISNSLFVVNMSSLAIALVLQTGATRAYIGLTYTAKNIFKPKKTKEEYPSMQDFYDDRAPSHIKQVSYIIVVNGFYLVVSFIFAQLYLTM